VASLALKAINISTLHLNRKDVERAFDVLQAKYAIMKGQARKFNSVALKYIVDCVIWVLIMGKEWRN
jgi:hypothetical protein